MEGGCHNFYFIDGEGVETCNSFGNDSYRRPNSHVPCAASQVKRVQIQRCAGIEGNSYTTTEKLVVVERHEAMIFVWVFLCFCKTTLELLFFFFGFFLSKTNSRRTTNMEEREKEPESVLPISAQCTEVGFGRLNQVWMDLTLVKRWEIVKPYFCEALRIPYLLGSKQRVTIEKTLTEDQQTEADSAKATPTAQVIVPIDCYNPLSMSSYVLRRIIFLNLRLLVL